MTRSAAPSREDGVVRSLSEVVGGPLGDHAGPHPWWTARRAVLLVAAVVLALGTVAKAPCLDRVGETGQGRYAKVCWSDVTTAYVQNGYVEGHWPFTDDEQVRSRYAAGWLPPVPAYAAVLAARVTAAFSPDAGEAGDRSLVPVSELAQDPQVQREARVFTLVTWVLLAGAGLVAVWLLAGVRRRRPWDAAAFAAAPVLLLFFPITWDLLAAGCVAWALWAAARGRSRTTGLAIGLGTAVSPVVALLLVPAALARARKREWGEAAATVAAALAAWLAMSVPALLGSAASFRASWRGTFHSPDVGSPWLVVAQALSWTPSRTELVLGAGIVLLVAIAAVGHLVWHRRWPVATGALVLMVVAALVLPSVGPATALVLLPLAAIAVRRWRDLLVWQACEVVHWVLLGFYVGGLLAPSGGGDAKAYWWAIAVRVAGLVWLLVAAVRAAGESADLDGVERRRGEPDPHVDVLADRGHPRP